MNALRAATAALLIAVTISAGPAGAQGVPDQLRAMLRRYLSLRASRSKAGSRCEVGPWSALDIVADRPPVRPDNAEAALRQLGGTRVVLKVDVAELRKQMLMEAREDIMRIARSERIGAPSSAIVRAIASSFGPGQASTWRWR